MEIKIGRQIANVPNENGAYETELGPIEVEVIGEQPRIWKVALEGEVMKGTPLKNRHKRTSKKVIYLNEYGTGAQDLSKKERVYVDLYPSSPEESELLIPREGVFDNGGY